MAEVESIKGVLTRKEEGQTVAVSDLLSTGSTLMNLACTGRWQGGFAKGMYFLLVGDSASGKTFLSLTCLAEAARNPAFDGYRFVYDNVEGGALMDVEKFFGGKVAGRLEPASSEGASETIEDFYFNLDDALGTDAPCIYILDSMDALSSGYESKKFAEKKEALRSGREAAGDYGDGKAKINAAGIRTCLAKLRDTGSILIVINQTRDNIGGGPFGPRKTRSGGHAMTFYATIEAWSSVRKKLSKTYKGTTMQTGVLSRVAVQKNRFTGRLRTVDVPILHSYGIDDIGSCVDYLLAEKRWTQTKQTINTGKDLGGVKATRQKLIEHIVDGHLEQQLSETVAKVWTEIETACAESRRPRYE